MHFITHAIFFKKVAGLRDLFLRHCKQLHFFRSIQHAFSSPEAAVLLVSTKNYMYDLWPYQFSEHVQRHWKSAIHRLSTKSDKCDWLRVRNNYYTHVQKIKSGQKSRFLVLTKKTKWAWPLETGKIQHAAYTYSCCNNMSDFASQRTLHTLCRLKWRVNI